MIKIIGISGSLRSKSYNTALLRAMAGMMPNGADLTIASIADIPLYNQDIETSLGIPRAVVELKSMIEESDGIILATPEYNNSMPGVLKNAIDWLSRPPSDVKKVFGGKPVGIMGASPGRFGAILGQDSWLSVMHILGAQVWGGERLRAANAAQIFDENGLLTDLRTVEEIRKYAHEFVQFACSPIACKSLGAARSYTGVDR